jgi:glycosyltransferase involved in cell wall biosynthesis
MKHILIISSYGSSLINFRLNLIKDILSKGYKVSVAAPSNHFSNDEQKKLKDLGVKINKFFLSRIGYNLLKDIRTIYEIYRVIKNSKPDIIISYTSKPIIYTGIILKFFPKIIYYPLITGLGTPFTEIVSIKKNIFKCLISQLYTFALKSSYKVIFQNKDDLSLFLKLKIVRQKKKLFIVNGSGVDLNDYPLSILPSKPVFLMVARLLVFKGIREYAEAAKIVKSSYPNVTFQLAGGLDQSPSCISSSELKYYINQGNIEYLGEIKSAQSILKSCKFYVLPSYYREGIPRSTLEALSTGRPVITSDSPGCRETVIHEKNGLLIPVKNVEALANAMIRLLEEKEEVIQNMAKQSFLIAKNKFDVKKVNKKFIDIIGL